MDERLAMRIDEAMRGCAFRDAARSTLDAQVYSLGLWYASGRGVVVSFEETLAGVRVTDAGGAWADLFSAGLLRAKHTEKQDDAFARLCEARGLAWDRAGREVVGHAFHGRASFIEGVRDAVMRVGLASIAIEGASVWLAPRAKTDRLTALLACQESAEPDPWLDEPLTPDEECAFEAAKRGAHEPW